MVKVAHQRRSGQDARHLPRRTAHIDVDYVGARRFGKPRALGHPARLAPCKLDNERKNLPVAFRPAHHIRPTARQLFARGHFGDDKPGPFCRRAGARHSPPERKIRNA